MTRELFIETIEALKKQHEHDVECSKAFKVILPNNHISCYNNHWVNNQLVKLLQVAMDDEHKHSWIEYYLWELDFGKKYTEGCVSEDGENIDLSDAGKLWDYLNSNLEV